MSKPSKPGELRDVTVDAISLVTKAANGERFKIFKSAKPEDKEPHETIKSAEPEKEKKAPEEVKKDERGLFRILKEFFTGADTVVEKGEAADVHHVNEVDTPAADSEIEKSGRKISSSRLSKLKNAQAILNEILSELDDADTPKEAEELTKEEVQNTVDDAVKAVNVEEVVKNALAPIIERIEKIENARGLSNRVPEDSAVEKSANDFWGGIF